MLPEIAICYTERMGILDVIFPKRCVNCRKLGSYLCSSCFLYLSFEPEIVCLMCNRPSWNGLTHPKCLRPSGIDGSFSVLSYNTVVKRLLFTYKYRPYVSDLRGILSELFVEGIIQNEHFIKRRTPDSVLIPVPLHSMKHRQRGYNHAALLAKIIGDKLGMKVIDVIVRTRKTTSQFLLKKEEREANVRGVFELKKDGMRIDADTVFLVDDVVTTGSTLKEITKILKKEGVIRVYGLTLAHGH